MRIMKLTPTTFDPMEAVVTKDKNKKLRFTIMHGSFPKRGLNTWGVKFYLKRTQFPIGDYKIGDTIKLDKNNYFVLPVKGQNGETVLDKQKNKIYLITEANDTSSLINHMVVFWFIPIHNKPIEVSYKGNVKEILRGTFGEEYLNDSFTAPAPVLDITGDCELTYSYIENDVKHIFTNIYTKKDNSWFRDVKTIDLKKD